MTTISAGNMERLIKTDEVSLMLGIPTQSVLRLVRSNKLPHIRYSARCIRYRPDEIHKYKESSTVKPNADQLPSEGV